MKIKLGKVYERFHKEYPIHEYVSIEKMIERLNEIKALIPDNAKDIQTSITAGWEHDYYDSIDTHITCSVSYWVPKSEEKLKLEEELREERKKAAAKSAATRKANQEAKEKAEYERLKAKYDDTNS